MSYTFLTQLRKLGFFCLLLTGVFSATAQEQSAVEISLNEANKFAESIDKKAQKLSKKLNKSTARYLKKFERSEKTIIEEIKRNLPPESVLSIERDIGLGDLSFTSDNGNQINVPYFSTLDSLKTSLQFLLNSKENRLLVFTDNVKIEKTINDLELVEDKFSNVYNIKQNILNRQEKLNAIIQQYNLPVSINKYKKEVYYYQQQIKEYKDIFQSPEKIEKKWLEILSNNKSFKKYFAKYSQLAGLFSIPSDELSLLDTGTLQTNAKIQESLNSRIMSGKQDAASFFSSKIQEGKSQLNEMKEKITNLDLGASDVDIPSFKPNMQKTKSFWKRLEFGTTIQNTRGNQYLPISSDLALVIGYKLNDKSIIGFGTSYKMGWGESIRNISITHQGMGIRSFLDWRLKRSLFVVGGFERNYFHRFTNLDQLRTDIDHWQNSALIGLSKKYKFGKKGKGDMRILIDLLYNQHKPVTQPVLFRLGYGL